MPDPLIVPRAEHPLSRRDIDPDALRVLYRLHQFNHTAHLVGGSVRDILLGRRPKDFDIGTSAHPYEVKKLFRNCWIIGRRFRLAHVRFGTKVVEVATFRRNVPDPPAEATRSDEAAGDTQPALEPSGGIRPDNTFGTPEEDAFRRDFTINALFYDIGTFSIIDYTGGLEDLKQRVIRSIGDPSVRFQEDPVRMFRAVAMAARLEFALDPLVVDAIAEHRQLIRLSSPARVLEEYYKVLRSGAAEATFRGLQQHGLLEAITPELAGGGGETLWPALRAIDTYRHRFEPAPASLTNPVLLGTLLVPLRLMPTARREPGPTLVDESVDSDGRVAAERVSSQETPAGRLSEEELRDAGMEAPLQGGLQEREEFATPLDASPGDNDADGAETADEREAESSAIGRRRGRRTVKTPLLRVGLLPIARGDTERLRQVLAMQRRLRDLESSPRAKRALVRRSCFNDALTWLDIHGQVPEVVEHWRGFLEALGQADPAPGADGSTADPALAPRRRRRRRSRRPRGQS